MFHYSRWKRFLDWCMVPIMYLVQGNFREVPQRTHVWNNVSWNADWYHQPWFVACKGDNQASGYIGWMFGVVSLLRLPLFHMPIAGGWKKFVVLEPVEPIVDWHIGWNCGVHGSGLSLITIERRVRMLVGPKDVKFFGLGKDGKQVELRLVGEGRVGVAGEFANVPLL